MMRNIEKVHPPNIPIHGMVRSYSLLLIAKGNGKAQIAVRVNCPHTTEYGKDDISSVAQLGMDIIVLPKVEDTVRLSMSTEMIEDSLHFEKLKKGGQSIWAMIESAQGVKNASSIAEQVNVEALVLGCNDLTKDLKAKFTTARIPLHYSMSKVRYITRICICTDTHPITL